MFHAPPAPGARLEPAPQGATRLAVRVLGLRTPTGGACALCPIPAEPAVPPAGPGRSPGRARTSASPPVAVIHVRRVDRRDHLGNTLHAVVAAATITCGPSVATRLFLRRGTPEVHTGPAVLDAFDHLHRRARHTGLRIRVYINHGLVRRELAAVADSFPAVEIIGAESEAVAPLLDTAAAALGRRIRRIESRFDEHAARVHLPELRVATDASKRRRKRGVGAAFVTESGRYAQEMFPAARTVLEGELRAIEMAVRSLRGRNLRVLSDSRQAIEALTGTDEAASERFGALLGSIVHRIHRLSAGRRVHYVWVRGHNGHRLNETADRLAVACRRADDARLTVGERDAIARGIVEDLAPDAPAPGRERAALAAA